MSTAAASATEAGLFEVLTGGTLAAGRGPTRCTSMPRAQVKFYVDDRYYADNIGGVSIKIGAWPWKPWKPWKPARAGDSPSTPVVSAVPEPSQFALLMAGLGVVGLVAHRRRA